jgi:hypothetical protein
MAIQTKVVRNALVWYDDRYDNRWVAAAGSNVLTWDLPVAIPKDDTTNDPSAMVNTEVGTNTVLSSTRIQWREPAGTWFCFRDCRDQAMLLRM